MRRVPDPNQMKYHDEIKEDLENDLLEKLAQDWKIFEAHLNQFSEQEGMGLLYGLASDDYIELKHLFDGDSRKVVTLVSITDAGRKYANILRDARTKSL